MPGTPSSICAIESPTGCTKQLMSVAVAERATDLPADVTIRLSAGIAEASAPCDALHLFKRADEALYAAKAAGRDAVHNDIQDARHG